MANLFLSGQFLVQNRLDLPGHFLRHFIRCHFKLLGPIVYPDIPKFRFSDGINHGIFFPSWIGSGFSSSPNFKKYDG